MSFETWKAEYYPVPAEETTKSQAIQHSLKKWIGLRKDNLRKHGLETSDGWVVDPSPVEDPTWELKVDSYSCALCEHYHSIHAEYGCKNCPITKANNGVSCDGNAQRDDVDYGDGIDAWSAWTGGKDPEPMIELLVKCL